MIPPTTGHGDLPALEAVRAPDRSSGSNLGRCEAHQRSPRSLPAAGRDTIVDAAVEIRAASAGALIAGASAREAVGTVQTG